MKKRRKEKIIDLFIYLIIAASNQISFFQIDLSSKTKQKSEIFNKKKSRRRRRK